MHHGGQVRDDSAERDELVGARTTVEAGEVAADGVHGLGKRLRAHRPGETEAFRQPDGTHVHAEALLDALTPAEGELGATATRVEDDHPPGRKADACLHGEVRKPALLLAGDHLDLDARPVSDAIDELVGVRGDSHPRRPDGRDRPHAVVAGLAHHGGDRLECPAHRLRLELAGLVETLAESRDLGAVDDGLPPASGARSARWNLTEFVPTSITA